MRQLRLVDAIQDRIRYGLLRYTNDLGPWVKDIFQKANADFPGNPPFETPEACLSEDLLKYLSGS